MESWRGLFDETAAFATGLGPERLIPISHSIGHGEGVVAVGVGA